MICVTGSGGTVSSEVIRQLESLKAPFRGAYFSNKKGDKRGLVPLHQKVRPSGRWLKRHSTHFIRIIVPRAAATAIFTLRRA